MDFSGVFPALITPFAGDGSVSVADLKHNIQQYNRTGVAGYVVNGSTGESVLLSNSETEAVLVAVKETAFRGKKLIAGTGVESTTETIERTKRAAQLGYDAALVKTPYYYKPAYKPEVYFQHYHRVADASPIPVLLYSVPQFTGVALEPPEVRTLSASRRARETCCAWPKSLPPFRPTSKCSSAPQLASIPQWPSARAERSSRWRPRCRRSVSRFTIWFVRVSMKRRANCTP